MQALSQAVADKAGEKNGPENLRPVACVLEERQISA
jgi:hypothetical protein